MLKIKGAYEKPEYDSKHNTPFIIEADILLKTSKPQISKYSKMSITQTLMARLPWLT